MRRSKFALSICLILSVVIGLSVLSSCGGGGGSRPVTKPGDEVIITPPGNRAPVVSQAFENVVLPPSSGRSRWESQPLGSYFSDPDGDTLEFRAQVDNSNVASAEISNTGSLVVHIEGSTTATITVTAQNSDRLSVEQNFTVTVSDRTVTPPPDHSDTPAGATDIFIEQTVEGHINSPEDVDYFRFEVPKPGVYEFTLESEISGLEISLRDENGNILAVDRTESPAIILLAIKVQVILIVVRCANPICVAAIKEALALAGDRDQSLAVSFWNLGVSLGEAVAIESLKVKVRSDAPFERDCDCLLTFMEPGDERREFDLDSYLEAELGVQFLSFKKKQDGPSGLQHEFDSSNGIVRISANRNADVGVHEYEVQAQAIGFPEVQSFTFKVNVWALPRVLPGKNLKIVAKAGEKTTTSLKDIIGPPEEIGKHHPPIAFGFTFSGEFLPGERTHIVPLRAKFDPLFGPFLVVDPQSDLAGEFSLLISARFSGVERTSQKFKFMVIVSGGPRIIPGSSPLSISVPLGGSGEIDLTNHIEDPLGGPLSFTRKSVPSGFRVATNGSQWTIEAGEDMEPGEYDITLTATDSNDLSDDFALDVTVGGCQAQVVFNDYDRWTPSQSFTSTLFLSQYTGDCKNGRANGRQGTFVASNATGQSLSYVGEWEDGEPRGEGEWRINTILSERYYKGEWQDRRPHGLGTGSIEYISGNTQRYAGDWIDGEPHGQGTWTALTDGDRYHYVGEFRNGLQHGRGTETNRYANGDRERLDGEFRNDVLWNGTSTWNGVSCRVVNGVWC